MAYLLSWRLFFLLSSNNVIVDAFRPRVSNFHYGGSSRPALTVFSRPQQQTLDSLIEWAGGVDIKLTSGLSVASTPSSGNALVSSRDLPSGSVVLTCPRPLVVSALSSGDSDYVAASLSNVISRESWRKLPWYARLSLLLHFGDGDGPNRRRWREALPSSAEVNAPLSWSDATLASAQYPPLERATAAQREEWNALRTALSPSAAISSADFELGMQLARSRAFSSPDVRALDVRPYALTALLVVAYVGLHLGPVENAANGAAVVVCANFLKDVVLPKVGNDVKRHIICPIVDMANHADKPNNKGNVELEYFTDAYVLALTQDVRSGEQVTISYGERSNDQLLQYYGFVQQNNPHDIFLLPPLGEWDVNKMEAVAKRTTGPRMGALDRAGLLKDNVVVTRQGIDPAVMQGLRALLSNDEEWTQAKESVGSFAVENSGGEELEHIVNAVVSNVLKNQLDIMGTTLDEDQLILDKMETKKSVIAGDGAKGMGTVSAADIIAVKFRMEKKKVLRQALETLAALQIAEMS